MVLPLIVVALAGDPDTLWASIDIRAPSGDSVRMEWIAMDSLGLHVDSGVTPASRLMNVSTPRFICAVDPHGRLTVRLAHWATRMEATARCAHVYTTGDTVRLDGTPPPPQSAPSGMPANARPEENL